MCKQLKQISPKDYLICQKIKVGHCRDNGKSLRDPPKLAHSILSKYIEDIRYFFTSILVWFTALSHIRKLIFTIKPIETNCYQIYIYLQVSK